MRKLLEIISISIAATALVTPALAVPYTFKGSKGIYTIDAEKGTYRGCLFSGGCITLGKKYLVPCQTTREDEDQCEVATWNKGEYSYSVSHGMVSVSKNGRSIFTDYLKN